MTKLKLLRIGDEFTVKFKCVDIRDDFYFRGDVENLHFWYKFDDIHEIIPYKLEVGDLVKTKIGEVYTVRGLFADKAWCQIVAVSHFTVNQYMTFSIYDIELVRKAVSE